MKSGKIIAIVVGALAAGLIVLMLATSDDSAPSANAERPALAPNAAQTPAQTPAPEQNVLKKSASDYQSDVELETVKKLRQSVENVGSEDVSRTYYRSCAPCHGKDGKGIIAPSIAGLEKAEILRKLQDYKSNLVPNTLMKGLFENIADAELDSLAAEISKFEK